MIGGIIRIFSSDKELVRDYLISALENGFKLCLGFREASARNDPGQVSLAENKLNLSFICMTKLVLYAQGIFKAGLHLIFILTSQMLHDTISSVRIEMLA